MRKTLILILIALSVAVTGCKPKEDKKFDTYVYFAQNPSCLQKIVEAENNKAPLAVQEYNKVKNNVVKIEFQKLTITHGTNYACKGYFTTVWTIKTEYFGEEQYEYLVPCEQIRYNPETEYILWEIKWPDEHPFADK